MISKYLRKTANRFCTYKKIRIIHSRMDDIHFNLATQQYLYNSDLDCPILFLWRNKKTIVIGRHQNPWKQCHLAAMQKDQVTLSRRITGGGAVYHDLGNTCFSFLIPYKINQQYDYKTVNNQILLKALKNMGISAEISGRNDLTHEGKKISGSAYKINLGNTQTGKGKKVLHHGTILFNVDTNALVKYLNPNKAKLISKGITSVASRVLNLTQKFPNANHSKFCNQVQQQFQQYHQAFLIQRRDSDNMKQIPQIVARYQELKSWNWLYGMTPSFTNNIQHRFNWGIIDLFLNVQDGIIIDGVVYSDSLNPDFISTLDHIIKTQKISYDFEGVNKLQKMLCQKFPEKQTQQQIDEMCQWLKEAM